MNCGSFVGYGEGVIILPMVIRVSSSNGTNDWTNANLDNTDFMLAFKNSHIHLVHLVAINLNNIDILQPVPLSNAYLTFIQHSELSYEDELLNALLHGYCKDSANSWSYEIGANVNGVVTGTSRGAGICNNANMTFIHSTQHNDVWNEGMLRRQKLVNKYSTDKQAVLGNIARNKMEAKNYVDNDTDGKYYYYNVILRLKDLQLHFFPNFPLTMGTKFKITLILNNNVTFTFQKTLAGLLKFDTTKFSNVTSATNPLMIAASYNTYSYAAGVADNESTNGEAKSHVAQHV